MERAFELARKWPNSHPNPRVGAVVVSSTGAIAGEGWHEGPGTHHAEVMALNQAGDIARGATLYVSLEPCSHQGRTPPCTEALISAQVSTVVVGTIDPDPRVSGRGVKRLQEAGIEVITGVRESEARDVDRAYFHHRETGLAMVTAKWAMTLDGAIAAADDSSRWITGTPARAEVHHMRSRVDAVVIGAGTLRADDPRLDVRLEDYEGPQPRPVVIRGRQSLPEQARIWERDPVVVSTRPIEIPSGEALQVPGDDLPDPKATVKALGERGLIHLLLEGGPVISGAWWRAGVITNGYVFIGSRVGGGTGRSPMAGTFATIADAGDVEFRSVRSVGDDVVIAFEKRD